MGKQPPTTTAQTSRSTPRLSLYIDECTDDVTDTKTIGVLANQKPRLTGDVFLNAWNAAWKAGNKAGLRTAWASLSCSISVAKRKYSRKIALKKSYLYTN